MWTGQSRQTSCHSPLQESSSPSSEENPPAVPRGKSLPKQRQRGKTYHKVLSTVGETSTKLEAYLGSFLVPPFPFPAVELTKETFYRIFPSRILLLTLRLWSWTARERRGFRTWSLNPTASSSSCSGDGRDSATLSVPDSCSLKSSWAASPTMNS